MGNRAYLCDFPVLPGSNLLRCLLFWLISVRETLFTFMLFVFVVPTVICHQSLVHHEEGWRLWICHVEQTTSFSPQSGGHSVGKSYTAITLAIWIPGQLQRRGTKGVSKRNMDQTGWMEVHFRGNRKRSIARHRSI